MGQERSTSNLIAVWNQDPRLCLGGNASYHRSEWQSRVSTATVTGAVPLIDSAAKEVGFSDLQRRNQPFYTQCPDGITTILKNCSLGGDLGKPCNGQCGAVMWSGTCQR